MISYVLRDHSGDHQRAVWVVHNLNEILRSWSVAIEVLSSEADRPDRYHEIHLIVPDSGPLGADMWIGVANSEGHDFGQRSWRNCLGVLVSSPQVEAASGPPNSVFAFASAPLSSTEQIARFRASFRLMTIAAAIEGQTAPMVEVGESRDLDIRTAELVARFFEARFLDDSNVTMFLPQLPQLRQQMHLESGDIYQLNRLVGVLESIQTNGAAVAGVHLAEAARARWGRTKREADADWATSLFRNEIVRADATEDETWHARAGLADLLRARAKLLDESPRREALREAWGAVSGAPTRLSPTIKGFVAGVRAQLGLDLARYGDHEVTLSELISQIDEVLAALPASDDALRLQSIKSEVLGQALNVASELERARLLDAVLELRREVLAGTPVGTSEWAKRAANLAQALHERYSTENDADALDEAVDLLERAVASTSWNALRQLPTDTAIRLYRYCARLERLSSDHRNRSGERSGAISSLANAIAALRSAIELVDDDGPNRLLVETELAEALLGSYRLSGQAAALAEAIILSDRVVVELSGEGDLYTHASLTLGHALLDRHILTETLPDLERAGRICDELRLRASPLTEDDGNALEYLRAVMLAQRVLTPLRKDDDLRDLESATYFHGDKGLLPSLQSLNIVDRSLLESRIDDAVRETQNWLVRLPGRTAAPRERTDLRFMAEAVLGICRASDFAGQYRTETDSLLTQADQIITEALGRIPPSAETATLQLLLARVLQALAHHGPSKAEMERAYRLSDQVLNSPIAERSVRRGAASVASRIAEYLHSDEALGRYRDGLRIAIDQQARFAAEDMDVGARIAAATRTTGFVGGVAAYEPDLVESAWVIEWATAPTLRRGLGSLPSSRDEFQQIVEALSETTQVVFVAQSIKRCRLITVTDSVWAEHQVDDLAADRMFDQLRKLLNPPQTDVESPANDFEQKVGELLGLRLAPDRPVVVVSTGWMTFVPLSAWLSALRPVQLPVANAISAARPPREVSVTRGDSFFGAAFEGDSGHGFLMNQDVKECAARFEQRLTLRAAESTPSAIARALQEHRVALIACHGGPEKLHPPRSELVLQDGSFTTSDAMALDLNSLRLAVLAACRSGVPDQALAEAAFGLHTAMLSAGAGAVIASPFSEDDSAASAFSRTLFRELTDGAPLGKAFSTALGDARESDSNSGFSLTLATARSLWMSS